MPPDLQPDMQPKLCAAPEQGDPPTESFATAVEAALAELLADGCVAFPTETVWGLAVSARREVAVERLRAWKGRAADHPMAVLASDLAALDSFGCEVTARARSLAERFWPGPLTLVLPCGEPLLTGSDGAIGVRCSSHPVAAALAKAAERAGLAPLTATSLNRTGEPEARTREEAVAILTSHPGPLLPDWQGADAGGQAPSSVVDLCGAEPRVLRVGALGEDVLLRSLSGGAKA